MLVSRDGEVKLADFGASIDIQQGLEVTGGGTSTGSPTADGAPGARSLRGSVLWSAPEVLRGGLAGPAADVWSLGCTVIECLEGEPPWSDLAVKALSQSTLVASILEALDGPAGGRGVPLPEDASEIAKDFLGLCLRLDPEERPTVAALVR